MGIWDIYASAFPVFSRILHRLNPGEKRFAGPPSSKACKVPPPSQFQVGDHTRHQQFDHWRYHESNINPTAQRTFHQLSHSKLGHHSFFPTKSLNQSPNIMVIYLWWLIYDSLIFAAWSQGPKMPQGTLHGGAWKKNTWRRHTKISSSVPRNGRWWCMMHSKSCNNVIYWIRWNWVKDDPSNIDC